MSGLTAYTVRLPAKATGNEITGTVDASASVVLIAATPPATPREFLQIQNGSSASGNQIAFTLDGTTPVIGGNGFQLGGLGSATYDLYVPQGSVTLIGSGSGVRYNILVG